MRRAARPDPQAGFTLIELIVVITIMGLLSVLVLTRQPMRSTGLETQITVRALTNSLRLARSRAIVQGRVVPVITGPGGFSVDGGPVWRLAGGQSLSASQVLFLRGGGAATGAPIVLAAGARHIQFNINWLTGIVTIGELSSQQD